MSRGIGLSGGRGCPFRLVRAWALGAVALALAGCGTALAGAEAGPSGRDRNTVIIAEQPLPGYAATLAVFSRILRTHLGYRVVTIPLTESGSWEALASGTVDLVVENWVSPDRATATGGSGGMPVSLGPTGTVGRRGWYVPTWMLQRHPGIDQWQNLNQYADALRGPGSADLGRLLDPGGGQVTADSALVANLGLRYSVTYSGGEGDTIQQAIGASTRSVPLLFHLWQPHWLLGQYEFTRVTLPGYTPGCDADPALVACDYPERILDKVASRDFAKRGGRALALATAFTWSNADENAVAGDMVVRGLSADQAAARWMDAHPQVWRAWLERR